MVYEMHLSDLTIQHILYVLRATCIENHTVDNSQLQDSEV